MAKPAARPFDLQPGLRPASRSEPPAIFSCAARPQMEFLFHLSSPAVSKPRTTGFSLSRWKARAEAGYRFYQPNTDLQPAIRKGLPAFLFCSPTGSDIFSLTIPCRRRPYIVRVRTTRRRLPRYWQNSGCPPVGF